MKYLVLVVVVVGMLWWMLRRPRVASKGAAAPREPATFVACAHCGVHLPSGDAVQGDGQHFCSDAHRIAGARDRSAR
jgi:uncharacterized protein